MEVALSAETRQTLEENNLAPLWEVEEEEMGSAREDLVADIWKWEDVERAIEGIAEDVAIEELPPGFRRRVTVPVNATYGSALSHTIYVGVQTVSPGETAPAHRHGANAMRFTIDGHPEMKTAVGGEAFPMRDNDLVTTPQWEWHDHTNDSDEEVAWLDVLDLPMMFDALNIGNVFEDHEENRQTLDKPEGYHTSQFGEARAAAGDGDDIPGPFEGTREPTPPYRFGWAEMSDSLEYAAAHDEGARSPHDGVVMEYTNPARGSGPLFPTFGVRAQLLPDGEATEPHRHNATEVYYVVSGSGQTEVGEATFDWSARDIFVVPPNESHAHNPDGEARLVNISDRPMLEGINFYHEVAE